jgi:hypothetical protein
LLPGIAIRAEDFFTQRNFIIDRKNILPYNQERAIDVLQCLSMKNRERWKDADIIYF